MANALILQQTAIDSVRDANEQLRAFGRKRYPSNLACSTALRLDTQRHLVGSVTHGADVPVRAHSRARARAYRRRQSLAIADSWRSRRKCARSPPARTSPCTGSTQSSVHSKQRCCKKPTRQARERDGAGRTFPSDVKRMDRMAPSRPPRVTRLPLKRGPCQHPTAITHGAQCTAHASELHYPLHVRQCSKNCSCTPR